MSSESRPPRRDAERVPDTAQRLFADHGLDVALERIAWEAGVCAVTVGGLDAAATARAAAP